MEGGRTDGWGEWWQLLKEETLGLPGTRLVLQLQTQTHTLPDFTQINVSISASTSSFTSSRRSECWWSCRPSPVFTLSQSSFFSKVTSLSLKRKVKYVKDQLSCCNSLRLQPEQVACYRSLVEFKKIFVINRHQRARGGLCMCRPLQDALNTAPVWMLELLSSRIGVNANRDRGWSFPCT